MVYSILPICQCNFYFSSDFSSIFFSFRYPMQHSRVLLFYIALAASVCFAQEEALQEDSYENMEDLSSLEPNYE